MKLFMVSHLFWSKLCNVHLKVHCRGNRQFCSKYRASAFSVVRTIRKFLSESIDLFSDTVAILNLLDLRSIVGCQGGTRSVFTPNFRAKRALHCIFSGKRRSLLHPNTAQLTFFFPLQSFSKKTQRKIGPKSGRKYWANISDRSHARLHFP